MELVKIEGPRTAAIVHNDPFDLFDAQLSPAVTVGKGHRRKTVVDLPSLEEGQCFCRGELTGPITSDFFRNPIGGEHTPEMGDETF